MKKPVLDWKRTLERLGLSIRPTANRQRKSRIHQLEQLEVREVFAPANYVLAPIVPSEPCSCSCTCAGATVAVNGDTGNATVKTAVGGLKFNSQSIAPVTAMKEMVATNSATSIIQIQPIGTGITSSPTTYTALPAGTPFFASTQVPRTALAGDGMQPVTFQTTVQFSDGASDLVTTQTVYQAVPTSNSPGLPAGWSFGELSHVSVSPDGPSIVTSGGGVTFFPNNQAGAGLGDITGSTLTTISGGAYQRIDAAGNITIYSPTGLLVSETDSRGNTTAYSYTDANSDGTAAELSAITYPDGTAKSITYANGLVESITDPTGLTITLTYDNGKLVGYTEPDPDGPSEPLMAAITSFGYDASTGLLNSMTDSEDNETIIGYDEFGRGRSISRPGIATPETFTPVLGAGLSSSSGPVIPTAANAIVADRIDSEGRMTLTKVDQFARPTERTDAKGKKSTISRDAKGRPQSTTTPADDNGSPLTTTASYDTLGNMTSRTNPDGSTETWVFDLNLARPLNSLPTSHTDVRGFVTKFTYDGSGNLLTQREVVGLVDTLQNGETDDVVTTFTYYAVSATIPLNGLVETMTDPLGRTTRYHYDMHGNPSSIVYAEGTPIEATETFVYTPTGLLTDHYNELGAHTEYHYDARNRLKRTILPDPDGNAMGSLPSPELRYEYDSLGRKWKEYDALNRLTEYKYDERGNLKEVLRPDHDNDGQRTVTKYNYDDAGQLRETIDPLGRVTTYKYDDNGNQTETIGADPATGLYSLTNSPVYVTAYDDLNQVTSQTSPLGFVTRFNTNHVTRTTTLRQPNPDGSSGATGPLTITVADAAGNIVSSTDPLGRVTTTTYDRWGRPLTVTQPDADLNDLLPAPVTTYAYDKVGNLLSETDPLGRITTYDYDSRNRRFSTTLPDPDDNPTGGLTPPIYLVTFDDAGRMKTWTDPLSRVTHYDYDNLGQIRFVRQPDVVPGGLNGPLTTYQYDLAGRKISETDADGHTTLYGYDLLDNLVSIIQPQQTPSSPNPVTIRFYNAAGEFESETDPIGRVTTYHYDGLGRLKKVVLPDPYPNDSLAPPEINHTYDQDGRRRTTTDANGNVTTSDYDALGRVILVTQPDPDGPTPAPRQEYKYDAAGQLSWTTNLVEGEKTAYGYDRLGRTITTTASNVLDPNFVPVVTTTTYDQVGNRKTSTDGLGHTTEYVYDNLDRVIQELQPAPAANSAQPTTTYTYDPIGNRLSLTDPVGNVTSWVYNELDRPIRQQNPNGFWRYSEYSPGGNLDRQIDRLGRIREYTYDGLNAVKKERWLQNGSEVYVMEFDYDLAGQLESSTEPSVSYSYGYDGLGRRDSEFILGLPAATSIASTFDNVGNRRTQSTTVSGVTGFETTWGYDALNRIESITQVAAPGPLSVSTKNFGFTFDTAGRMTSLRRFADLNGNDEIATSTYDYDGLGRLASLQHTQGMNALAGYTYIWDAAHRIISIDSVLDGLTIYDYDNTNQLTDADHATQTDEGYSYDLNGNRTLPGYVVGTNNLLQTDGVFNYEYDAEGNRSAKTEIATGYRTEYTWDHRNRLMEVTEYDNCANGASLTSNTTCGGMLPDGYGVTWGWGSSTATTTDVGSETISIDYWSNAHFISGSYTYVTSSSNGGYSSSTNYSNSMWDAVYISGYGVGESSSTTITLSVDPNNIPPEGLDVSYSVSGDSRISGYSGTQHVTYESPSFSISVSVSDDQIVQGTSSFSVYASTSQGSGYVSFGVDDNDEYAMGSYDGAFWDTVEGWTPLISVNGLSYEIETSSSAFNDNSIVDGTRSFTIRFWPSGHPELSFTSNGSILDNDYQVVYTAYVTSPATEGGSGMVYVTYSGSGSSSYPQYPSVYVSASDRSANSSDYYFNSSSYFGETWFSTTDDSEPEPTESFAISIGLSTPGSTSGGLVLTLEADVPDNDAGNLPRPVNYRVEYKYDYLNRMTERQEFDPSGQLAKEEAFVYDGNQVALKFENGELTNNYLWGAAVDQLLADEQFDVANNDSETLYPLADHLGSTNDLAVYDSLTQITVIGNHRIFDSFGILESETNAVFTTDFRWTGRWFDVTTGLQNNLNRWYDPRIGQWVSEDPKGFPAGDSSLRRYVGNRTVIATDPTGLEPPAPGENSSYHRVKPGEPGFGDGWGYTIADPITGKSLWWQQLPPPTHDLRFPPPKPPAIPPQSPAVPQPPTVPQPPAPPANASFFGWFFGWGKDCSPKQGPPPGAKPSPGPQPVSPNPTQPKPPYNLKPKGWPTLTPGGEWAKYAEYVARQQAIGASQKVICDYLEAQLKIAKSEPQVKAIYGAMATAGCGVPPLQP